MQKETRYLQDPVWHSWLALVEAETFAMREQFTLREMRHFDDLLIDHQRKRRAVKEYEGTDKPKLLYRNNYPVDVIKFGPLILSMLVTALQPHSPICS